MGTGDAENVRLLQVGGAKLKLTVPAGYVETLTPLQQVFGMAKGLLCSPTRAIPPDWSTAPRAGRCCSR